jgi:hypothetical protein
MVFVIKRYIKQVIFTVVANCCFQVSNGQSVVSLKQKIDSLKKVINVLTKENTNLKTQLKSTTTCPCGYPSISFSGVFAGLTAGSKTLLVKVAKTLKNNAGCSIQVISYPAPAKASNMLCAKRLDAIKRYLTEEQGIISDRVNLDSKVSGGDQNTIDITCQE